MGVVLTGCPIITGYLLIAFGWMTNLIKMTGGAYMIEMLFHFLETLFIGLIIGGGVIMAACVRPFLLQVLSGGGNRELVSTVEGISIKAWNRYNRYAFFSSLLLLLLDLIRYFAGLGNPLWHMGILGIIVLAFLRKFQIDRQLSVRLQEKPLAAAGSAEQNAGHRQVERLSKIILFLAVIAVVLPK
jgi:hypothetical protein